MNDKELKELLENANFMYLSNKNQLSFGAFIKGANKGNISIKQKDVIICYLNTSSFCEFAYDDYEYDGKEYITFYNKNGNTLDLKVK